MTEECGLKIGVFRDPKKQIFTVVAYIDDEPYTSEDVSFEEREDSLELGHDPILQAITRITYKIHEAMFDEDGTTLSIR